MTLDGNKDKELFQKHLLHTVSSMAALDRVLLPNEFLEKLTHLIDSISADAFDGCVEGAEADI
jgi:hypothetical protein